MPVLKNKALDAGWTRLCIDKYAESVADQALAALVFERR
ncbi:UNVERIFIED_ORG: hypothetical protein HNP28_003816 [Comamonas terrigena]